MKAIRVHQFGGPEVLKLEEIPTPKPEAGQVLLRVRAVGVNPYDTYMRAGTYAIKPPLPYTPGSDAAGTVEAVGSGVTKVKPGDRVYTAKTLSGVERMPNMHWRSKNRYTACLTTFHSSRGPAFGFRTAPHFTRFIISPKRGLRKLCWCTARAVEWAQRPYKWLERWA